MSNPAELAQQRFLQSVAQAVARLDSNGERSMSAIENSDVKLTLDTPADSVGLSVLCNNGGKPLHVFMQSLSGVLGLAGQVSEPACSGAGRDDDPFVLKFHLHYESGRTSMFYEAPPELSFTVEKPEDDDALSSSPLQERESQFRRFDSKDLPPEPPPQPAILSPHRLQESHTVVQLSQGWSPVKLPDAVHADSPFGTVDSTVTFTDGALTLDRKLTLKREKVEVAELPAFQKWVEATQGFGNIALRSTLYYPDRNASAGTDAQKKAADLIDEAYRDIEAHELEKAEAALKQAEAVDPGHEILHENKGELAAARGDMVTALAEYRKELEAYPNALIEMESIAGAQRKLGDTDGAIITLQRWMQADPNSPFAATSLMNLYHDLGRDDLATRTGDEAMISLTKDAKRDTDFLLVYGHEQALMGQARDAAVTLGTVLDLTVDNGIVNDAAFLLSEQGLALDRSEQVVREALARFNQNEPGYALSYSYSSDGPENTSLLLATWDTLGWILYKKGSTQEAESYIRAAWRSRQDIAIGRHLGDILLAGEKPLEAADAYTLALAALPEAKPGSTAKNPDEAAVRAALAQLKEKGVAPAVTNPKAALLALRTLNLGPAGKPRAVTPCTVSLSANELACSVSYREEPITVTDVKLLSGFFPPGSQALLNRQATIQCGKTCTLIFAP